MCGTTMQEMGLPERPVGMTSTRLSHLIANFETVSGNSWAYHRARDAQRSIARSTQRGSESIPTPS